MAKSIIKEIIIILLLVIAIILALGVLFYDYIPTREVVPVPEKYTVPDTIKEELASEVSDLDNTPVANYEITESDLDLYEKTKSYDAGKVNPFSSTAITSTDTGKPANSSGTSNNTTTTNENNTTNDKNSNKQEKNPITGETNVTGTIYEDTGKK